MYCLYKKNVFKILFGWVMLMYTEFQCPTMTGSSLKVFGGVLSKLKFKLWKVQILGGEGLRNKEKSQVPEGILD